MQLCSYQWQHILAVAIASFSLQTFAQDDLPCNQRFPGDSPEIKDKRLNCYDEANKEKVDAGYHLDRLWPTSSNDPGIVAYKQNYLLVTDTNSPNNAPTSANPQNQVTTPSNYKHVEAKFQFSFKAQYPHPDFVGESNSLWFGYTQQSNWQVTNVENSRPFRESNYEPELLIFSHQFQEHPDWWASPRFLNFVPIVHQSNGQSLPRSRSWNRGYLQLGLEKTLESGNSLALLIRPWWRYGEPSATDDNPDITHYLGHGDIELLYWNKSYMLSALARSRSLQIDLSIPMRRNKPNALHFHLQAFSGYGESLIDYNQRHNVFGVGLSFPYDSVSNSKQ